MKRNKGFISLIFMIVVALMILYYLHIPLGHILDSPITKKVAYITKDLSAQLWKDFLLLFQFVKDILAGNV